MNLEGVDYTGVERGVRGEGCGLKKNIAHLRLKSGKANCFNEHGRWVEDRGDLND